MPKKEEKKLKTLKDCFMFVTIDDEDRPIHEREYNELKQAAREWIKELEKNCRQTKYDIPEEMEDFYCYIDDYDKRDSDNLRNWIKHFFNLDFEKEE